MENYKGDPSETFSEKSLSVSKKIEIDRLEVARIVKNLAHTHRFEHETSGFKSKHLNTRPRTQRLNCATCLLKRVLSRGKKAPALSNNTCLS